MANNKESQEVVSTVVNEVSKIVSEMAGIQLGERQGPMVENRLRTRMLKLNLETFEEYLNFLKKNQETESQALLSLLTTHHTYFFREFSHFEHLLNHGLNSMIDRARARGDKTVRVWSAACSRGQEVYSLAMFFNFHMRAIAPDIKFEIYASDVDPESVDIAKNGVYKNEELKQCPAMYMEGNWIRGSGNVKEYSKVKDHLKAHCKFQPVNLFQPEAFLQGKTFDLIFCRNVFIYFNQDQIKSITTSFLKHLDPKGYIFLGVSETLNGLSLPIALTGPSVYRHKEAVVTKDNNTGFEKIQGRGIKIPSTLLDVEAIEAPTPQEKKIFEILCVDDSQTIHALLGKILTSEHHFVIKAKAMNGREALDILKTQTFDGITLDLHMPEVDGVGFLKEYKGNIPVVVLSSINRDDPSVAQQALKYGAKDYIEKPSLENFAQACNEIRSKLKTVLAMSAPVKPAASVAKPAVAAKPAPLTSSKPAVSLSTQRPSAVGSKPVSTLKPLSSLKTSSTSVKPGVNLKSTSSSNVRPLVKPTVASSMPLKATGSTGKPMTALNTKTSGPTTSASGNVVKVNSQNSPVKKKIRTLIVDDSATIRKILKQILSTDPTFEVVAEAERPSQVEDLIQQHKPDVITLDINMPEMDGVTLLKSYLPKYKIPTVMISSISREEGPQVLEALESGAVDYIQKPEMNEMAEASQLIRDRLKIASQVKIKIRNRNVKSAGASKFSESDSLVLIGSSTGGTEALREVFQGLPKEIPPILVVQHIPPVFSAAFAQRLNSMLPFEVREAKDGDVVQPNLVLIAPGGKQMGVKKSGSNMVITITDEAPVNRHKPSVDYLFQSVARLKPSKLVAGVLTGMGADGARELKTLRQQGARTFAQDEATSIVYGMPKEAFLQGGAESKVALEDVATHIVDLCNQIQKTSKKSA